MVHYNVSEAKRVTGFTGGYSWNELSRTELQWYEYDYELHLAEQAAQSEDPSQWADSNSDSVPDMPEYVTDGDMPGLVTDDESDDEVDFPSSTSPLPGLTAE